VRIVKDLLRAKTQEGMTVFMSTHTLAMAEEMADRVGIMVRGDLRFLGTVAELREQMALETTSLENLYLELTTPAADASGRRPAAGPGGA
jgi:ABC-2 type transport system ATP-binding protein